MLSNASSGCAARTSLRSVSANASGRWLVRVTTKTLRALAIGVRQVNRPLPLRFGEPRLFYRADNADNGEEICFLLFVAMEHLLAERSAIGPVTPGKIFIHHAEAFRAVGICRSEKPTFAQRNPERREIIAVYAIGIMTVQ